MPYVSRNAGAINGLYANAQPGYAEEFLADNHADVLTYVAATAPGGAIYATNAKATGINLLDTDTAGLMRLIRAICAAFTDAHNAMRQQVIGINTGVWDPASMANGAGVTSPAITVTGAAFGDVVDVGAPYSLAGIVACGFVSAANTVMIRLHNGTGGAVNLLSGTWKVVVRRPAVTPVMSYADAKTNIRNRVNDELGEP